MSRVALIFGVAILALMAGALMYARNFLPISGNPDVTTPYAKVVVSEDNISKDNATVDMAATPTPERVSHPDFALPNIDGVARTMADWDGKIRVLNFWATWCAPCRREIPVLKAFQEEQSDNGFQIIGIAIDEVDEVVRYAEGAKFNYPVLIGQEDAMAVAESSGIQFMALPFTMFVASNGEFINAHMGELHDEQLQIVVDVMTRFDREEISIENARELLSTL